MVLVVVIVGVDSQPQGARHLAHVQVAGYPASLGAVQQRASRGEHLTKQNRTEQNRSAYSTEWNSVTEQNIAEQLTKQNSTEQTRTEQSYRT